MNTMYVTDLDHTFLHSDLSISDFSADVWNRKSKDNIMTIATARSFQKAQELLKKIHINAPMILLDGAIIITPERKLIDLQIINQKIADALVNLGTKFDIDPFIIGIKDKELNEAFLYPKRLNTYQKNVLQGYKGDPRMQFNPHNHTMKQTLKIVYFGYENQLRPLYNEIVKIFSNTIEAKLSPEKYGGGHFLTLLHPKGDKAHALKTVTEYLKKDISDVTVFGDSINDIGMFKLAGTAVAVSNALDEVKEVADVVLKHSNDEDGVSIYINKG